jgi:hypothetical protein
MSKVQSTVTGMSFLTEHNEPRELSVIDTSPRQAGGDCYEVAGALRAAARFLEVLNQLPGTPAVRDWQVMDELINIADALTEEVAADFADQDAQNQLLARLRNHVAWFMLLVSQQCWQGA